MRRLGTLARKTKLRKVSKKEVRAKDLDKLCRQVIFKRDGYRCLRCGSVKNLQWCHVHSRRFKATRWAEWNLMTLCAGCHFWWHDRPIESSAWWRETFPVYHGMLQDGATAKIGKKEMELIYDSLSLKVGLETLLGHPRDE